MADESLGGIQPFDRCLLLIGVTEDAHAHTGLAQVRRHAHGRDADETDTRILQLATDDGHDLLAHLFSNLIGAVARHSDLRNQFPRGAQISSRSRRYVSIVSPGWNVSYPSSPMPHSCPAGISRTSSLKCFNELILPSNTSSRPRYSLTQPPRLTLPSTTRLPAMMPRRGILMGGMTSTLPSRIWRYVGSRRALGGRSTSSVSL